MRIHEKKGIKRGIKISSKYAVYSYSFHWPTNSGHAQALEQSLNAFVLACLLITDLHKLLTHHRLFLKDIEVSLFSLLALFNKYGAKLVDDTQQTGYRPQTM